MSYIKIQELLRQRDTAGLSAYLAIPEKHAANCVHRFDLAEKVKDEAAISALLRHLNFLREFSPGTSAGK